MRRKELVLLCLLSIFVMYFACNSDNHVTSSRAYKGHENDVDINNLCKVYPEIIGTRLDDCHTCHGGGEIEGEPVNNACDYCHQLMLHQTGHTYRETLNPFGSDYMDAGRDIAAVNAIKETDSDGDGHSNDEEIQDLRYPGNPNSMPGQPLAPMRLVSLTELRAMTSHEQFMLANAKRQQFDFYSEYEGVTFSELFGQLGIDLTGAEGITVIAPDGFMKSFTIDKIDEVHSQPLYYAGLDTETLGIECGFVYYPQDIPAGVLNEQPIPGEHRLMIAYERDGMAIEPCYLDPINLTIEGEGPLRLIVPQSIPGSPDRGVEYSPTTCADGYDYDSEKDHNAGPMVRGAIIVRIDPMPAGHEEFDYMNGWAYIDTEELIVYGNNVEEE